MLTDDYTFQFGTDGQLLNGDPIASDDPFVDITNVTGLDNPEFRITEREREGMDGGFVDATFEKMRTIVLEGTIFNVTDDFLDLLKSNYAPSADAQPFYFKAPGQQERIIYCKSYGVRYAWERPRSYGIVNVQIQLKAEDPTIYGDLLEDTAEIGTSESGFGFDLSFPFGFGLADSTGAAVLYNRGNKNCGATLEIVGPVTNPRIMHNESDGDLQFNIDLTDGDTLTVDLREKTIMLNGTTNRRGTLLNTSTWFLLVPGTNTIRFLGTSSGSPVLNCTARSAYR